MVVLPFANLSGEADSDTLCYGLLHEIVESLSLNKEFFVIASGTSLSYRDTRQSIRRISEELGVRYVVSGTLQRQADRLRVRAELSNGENQRVLWTDHYDRETSDLLLLQEEIARSIAVQLQPRVTRAEIKRVALRSPEQLGAWELFQRARSYKWSYDWLKESIEVLERAIELDARSAQAHALLSARLAYLIWYGEFDQIERAFQHLAIAMEISPQDPFILVSSCIVNMQTGNAQLALQAAEQALEINPNLAEGWAYHGACLGLAGQNARGLSQIDMALRLSPKDPLRYIWHLFRMVCLVGEERYEDAVAAGRASIALNQEWFFVHMSQAVNFAMLERAEEARSAWAETRRLNRQVSIPAYQLWLANSQLPESQQQQMLAALEAAGCS